MSNYVTIHAKISHEDKAKLDEQSDEQGITNSEMMRKLIRGNNKQAGLEAIIEQQNAMIEQQNAMLERILTYSIRSSVSVPLLLGISTPDNKKPMNELFNKIEMMADGVAKRDLNQIGGDNA